MIDVWPGGKEIYKLEQNVLFNRYCLAFWTFLARIEGDIKTFRGLLPVKLQMFCAYQITLSNACFQYEDFRVTIDKRTFQCQFGNVNELLRQLNYKECKRFKVILVVKG